MLSFEWSPISMETQLFTCRQGVQLHIQWLHRLERQIYFKLYISIKKKTIKGREWTKTCNLCIAIFFFFKSLELEVKYTRQNKQSNPFSERTVFPHFFVQFPRKFFCHGWTMHGPHILSNSFQKADCSQLLYCDFFVYIYVDTFLPVIWYSPY